MSITAGACPPNLKPRKGRRTLAGGGVSVSERNPCIATKKEMEPREPVVTYNGEDRSEAELRAVVGASFLCLRHFETLRHFGATLYATPPGFAFVFLWRFPGFRPLRGSTAGLFYTALPGLKFRLADARRFPICRAKLMRSSPSGKQNAALPERCTAFG